MLDIASLGDMNFRVIAEESLDANEPQVAQIQRQQATVSEGQVLGVDAFSWENATLLTYERADPARTIVVPATMQHQTPTERLFLLSPELDRDASDVREFGIVLFERDDERTTQRARMHVIDPGRRPIVGMTIDETRGTMEPIEHPALDLAGQPHAMETYWQCVGRCLGDLWPQIPWPLQIVCEGGCMSCLFGPNPFSCGACAGCLGGYGTLCFGSGCAG